MRCSAIITCMLSMLCSLTSGQDGRPTRRDGDGARRSMTQSRSRARRGGGLRDLLQPIWELDLTWAQRRQLRQIVAQYRQQMGKFFRPKDDEKREELSRGERQERINKPKREAYDKALAILTPEQRAQLVESTPAMDAPLGTGSGKTLPPGLLKQVRRTASRATVTSELPPNAVDRVVRPEGKACRDETFVRRVHVDLVGATPSVEQVLVFLNDPRPDKRAQLIDDLMERPGFADYQALRWCDVLRVKAEFPINLWPNGAAVYHRWVQDAMLKNKPYDEFARELLTASGSNFRNPPVNFYRATQAKDSYSLAEAAALTFMGSRTESWPAEQQKEIRKFFEHVAFKSTAEWKEEIVYWDRQPPKHSTATLPDGTVVDLPSDRDPRRVFADWLITATNRWFARAATNRIWFWLLGTGIVHEPDDFHPDNPPSNPELLDLLARGLVASDYDLRKLYRLILTSRTYQQDPPGYPLRPLDAETLQDTFCRIFGTQVSYSSDVPEPFCYFPKWKPSIALPDGTITSPFLMTFGRPSRDTGRESDRAQEATEAQRMFLINSTELNGWIERSWMLRVLPLNSGNRDTSLQYLWLEVLARYPTAEELRKAKQVLDRGQATVQTTAQDLLWMLINTREFSSRH